MTRPEASRGVDGQKRDRRPGAVAAVRRDRPDSASATPPALEREAARRARSQRGLTPEEPGSSEPDERPEGAELLDYEPESDTDGEADGR